MKIIILTEGSKEIGFGHITRCVSLYDAFKKKGITPQFVINGDQSVEPLLNRKNYRILDWIVEKEIFYSLIENADCVIVDSYLITNNLCNLISNIVKTPVFIDFIQKRKYKRGIVIDGSITQSKFIYGHEICYLKGIEYVMLREEFNEIPQKVIRKNIQSILITLGGTDIRNLMPLIQKPLFLLFLMPLQCPLQKCHPVCTFHHPFLFLLGSQIFLSGHQPNLKKILRPYIPLCSI